MAIYSQKEISLSNIDNSLVSSPVLRWRKFVSISNSDFYIVGKQRFTTTSPCLESTDLTNFPFI